MTNIQILNYAIQNGIINTCELARQVEQMEKQRLLGMHTGTIWQDSDGRWTTYVQEETGRRRVKKSKRENLENYLVKFYKQKNETHPLYETCLEWLASKYEYGELEQQSLDRYRQTARKYLEGSRLGKEDVRNITEVDLEDYIKRTIHDMEMTNRAWGNLRILINGTFKYARKKGWTDIRIRYFMDELELSKKAFKRTYKDDKQEVFTDAEIKSLKKVIESRPDPENLGILLAFNTGLRVGELAALKAEDLRGKVLDVHRTEIKVENNGRREYPVRDYTKGKEGHRHVIITDEAVEIFQRIAAANPGGEYLFERNGQRVHSQVFTNRLYRMCDTIGIERKSMHKARKTYATKMIDAGISQKLVQKQMGHANISTTLDHYYFDNLENDEAFEIIQEAMGGI